MRIAYLSTFYPFRGGIAQFNASLFMALEQAGHEVEAITFTRQYPQLVFPGKSQYVQDGDTATIIPSTALLDTINPISWQRSAQHIRQFNPDVLLMKYWMSFFAPSLGFVAGSMPSSTQVISILDNVLPHERRFFDRGLTKGFLKRNDGFVVMSKSVESDLDQLRPGAPRLFHRHPVYDHFGKPPDREEARREMGFQPEERVLLFYGFIRAYKGLDLLLEAFDLLNGPYRLIIAGEAYEPFEPYAARIAASPYRDRIDVRERYISDQETRLLFAAADACVLPYKDATQSGIALIAYHFELPLIATDTGGLKEYVQDGQDGILVAEAEASAIANGISRFFKMGGRDHFAQAMKALRQELSWDHLASGIAEFSASLKP
jgi:glycosyltransferase involved in cell wall biosynthesis